MNRPPTKQRGLIAGLFLVAAAGIFLMFRGPGFGGGGSGDGDGDNAPPSDAQVKVESSQSEVPVDDDAGKVVDIVIDQEAYLVKQADGSRKPASLDELKTLVAAAPGNADGIKVRIAKKASSLLQTERDLDQLLESAGIDASAVRRIPDPVD